MSQQTRITALAQRIAAEFKSVRSDMGGLKLRKMTLVAYLALPVKDPNTIYVVDGVIKLN